jgi:hypothetical protein
MTDRLFGPALRCGERGTWLMPAVQARAASSLVAAINAEGLAEKIDELARTAV